MKIFKTTDKKLEDLGFKKTREDKFGAEYERVFPGYKFTHKVALLHKENGRHLLQSYDPDLLDGKKSGCTNVGLTYNEAKLFLKKMKELGLH